MMGFALTPKLCHRRPTNWKVPKCSNRVRPDMPVHPRKRGFPCGIERATTHRRVAASVVSRIAHSHFIRGGDGTRWLASKKTSASIPGQATRSAVERQSGCAICDRALHHVSHLRLMKMANDRIHMKSHGGSSRLRQATAPNGNTEIGSQPTHEEPRTTSAAISFVSVRGCEVTLLQTYALRRRLEADQ